MKFNLDIYQISIPPSYSVSNTYSSIISSISWIDLLDSHASILWAFSGSYFLKPFSVWSSGGVRFRRAKRSFGVQFRCRQRMVSWLWFIWMDSPCSIFWAAWLWIPILVRKAWGDFMFLAASIGFRSRMIELSGMTVFFLLLSLAILYILCERIQIRYIGYKIR